jgi:hypothetical protein
VTLTERRDPDILSQLRERALPAIVEMAGWKHLPHALPAYILAGRLAGLSEQELQEKWNQERRDEVLGRLTRRR